MGDGLPRYDSMEDLMRGLRNALVDHFGQGASTFLVDEMREGDRPWLTFQFVLYDYCVVRFSYDRGVSGFGIRHGDTAVPLLRSAELGRDAIDDLPGLVAALDERVRLRIPDKYLEWYEASRRQ